MHNIQCEVQLYLLFIITIAQSLLTLKAATTAAGSTSPSNLTSHTTGAIIIGALSSRKRRFFSFRADTPTSTLGDNAYAKNCIKLCKTFYV